MNKLLSSEYFLVFLGGGLGSLLRYGIGSGLELSLGSTLAGMLSLFFVNVAGAFFLGIVSFHPFFANENKNDMEDPNQAEALKKQTLISLGFSWV